MFFSCRDLRSDGTQQILNLGELGLGRHPEFLQPSGIGFQDEPFGVEFGQQLSRFLTPDLGRVPLPSLFLLQEGERVKHVLGLRRDVVGVGDADCRLGNRLELEHQRAHGGRRCLHVEGHGLELQRLLGRVEPGSGFHELGLQSGELIDEDGMPRLLRGNGRRQCINLRTRVQILRLGE